MEHVEYWRDHLKSVSQAELDVGLHVAVFVEPYLTFVLDGRKTVESRFGVYRNPPYQSIREGDIILLKRSGGPINGIAFAQQTWFFRLTPMVLAHIRDKFARQLCAEDEAFWDERRNALYATLIELGEPRAIPPIACDKRDRRGWVTLDQRRLRFEFKP